MDLFPPPQEGTRAEKTKTQESRPGGEEDGWAAIQISPSWARLAGAEPVQGAEGKSVSSMSLCMRVIYFLARLRGGGWGFTRFT